jgi:hypothetical protein
MVLNLSKSKLFNELIEYQGYWIISKPVQGKVKDMLKIKAPKSRKELLQFIGIVNYDCDMCFAGVSYWLCSPVSPQAKSSMNGSQLINRLMTKSKRVLKQKYCCCTQIL